MERTQTFWDKANAWIDVHGSLIMAGLFVAAAINEAVRGDGPFAVIVAYCGLLWYRIHVLKKRLQ